MYLQFVEGSSIYTITKVYVEMVRKVVESEERENENAEWVYEYVI